MGERRTAVSAKVENSIQPTFLPSPFQNRIKKMLPVNQKSAFPMRSAEEFIGMSNSLPARRKRVF